MAVSASLLHCPASRLDRKKKSPEKRGILARCRDVELRPVKPLLTDSQHSCHLTDTPGRGTRNFSPRRNLPNAIRLP